MESKWGWFELAANRQHNPLLYLPHNQHSQRPREAQHPHYGRPPQRCV